MATAGKVTVAEVEHIVADGEIDADAVHTPGIFVHRVLRGDGYRKQIEHLTVRKRTATPETEA
jgi:acyl CoA:acetate/3-ketoacid CoA transferase